MEAERERERSEHGERADEQRQTEMRNILKWASSSVHSNWKMGK